MSVAGDMSARKARLEAVLSDSNAAITDKGGTAASNLSGLPAAIAGLKSGGKYQEKNVTPTGKEIAVVADSGYDALSRVLVAGDANLKPWNLPEGITIYGVTGTMKINATSEIPEDLPVSKEDADEAYKENVGEAPAETVDMMVLMDNSGNVTYGYLAEDFTITEFDPSTTDFKASGWKRLSYHVNGPLAGTWTYDDFSATASGGMNFIKNIRSCSREKLYYQTYEVWPKNQFPSLGVVWKKTGTFYSANAVVMFLDYVGSQWVLITIDGSVYRSADGEKWSKVSTVPISSGTLQQVIFLNNIFFAYNSTGKFISYDAVTWDAYEPDIDISAPSSYGNGVFVASARDTTLSAYRYGLYYSTDAKNWSLSKSNLGDKRGISFVGGLFFARFTGSNSGITPWLVSSDGTTWENSPSGIPSEPIDFIEYKNGYYIANRRKTTASCQFYYSKDGKSWNSCAFCDKVLDYFKFGIMTANGRWFASIRDGSLYYSDDLTTWTEADSAGVYVTGILYQNGIYVAKGQYEGDYGNYYLMHSSDGADWEIENSISGAFNIYFSNGLFLASLGTMRSGSLYSADGRNWMKSNLADPIAAMSLSDDRIVAYGLINPGFGTSDGVQMYVSK